MEPSSYQEIFDVDSVIVEEEVIDSKKVSSRIHIGSLGIWWQIWWQIRHQIWWFTKYGDKSVTKFFDEFGESPN